MLVHPRPDPIALKIGPLALHWIGLMCPLAFIQVNYSGACAIKAVLHHSGKVDSQKSG